MAGAVIAAPSAPCAAPAQPPPQAARDTGPRDRGLLWRVQKSGRTSYLYGTVHLGYANWTDLGPTVRAALERSDRVALELDLGDPAIVQRMQAALAAQPRAAPLPAELSRRLTELTERACLDSRYSQLRPELQATALLLAAARQRGLEPAQGVDGRVAAVARARSTPILSLETPEQQAGLLIGANAAETEAGVRQALDDLESGKAAATLVRLADAWSQSHWDELERYESWCRCLETSMQRAQQQRLVQQRNGPLARRIDAMHGAGYSVFAAVGSLHMIGPEGLPALLAQQGYTVERVKFPAPR